MQRRRTAPTSPVEGNLFEPMADGEVYGAPPPAASPVQPVPLAALAVLVAAGVASVFGRRG
jgi:hypothetical protein